MSTVARNHAVCGCQSTAGVKEELQKVFDWAALIRSDVWKSRKDPWMFYGTLGSDSVCRDNVSLTLYALLHCILQGPSKDTELDRKLQNNTMHKPNH